MADRRRSGTGCLYEKAGIYYGRWRTSDGRQLHRKVGRVRTPGERDGLTRAAAEREFRRMQEAEERDPRPVRGEHLPTIDELATTGRGSRSSASCMRLNSRSAA